MNKLYVDLEVIGQGPYIKAPAKCPYKEIVPITTQAPCKYTSNGMGDITGELKVDAYINKIHPAICAICRKCIFLSKDFEKEE